MTRPNDLTSSAQSELALAERLRRRYLNWGVFFCSLVIAAMVVQVAARFLAGRGDAEFWMKLVFACGLFQLALLPFFGATMWLGFRHAKRAAHLRDTAAL